MIVTASMRTDIPALYSNWFFNRVEAGFVDVLNPYSTSVPVYRRYMLNPDVVDAFSFCSKNPAPMISDTRHLQLMNKYPVIWGVTITPYDATVEKLVPSADDVVSSFRKLSRLVGKRKVHWRYDPIVFFSNHSREEDLKSHLKSFVYLARKLRNSTDKVVISFLDHYDKVKHNASRLLRPSEEDMFYLVERMCDIAESNDMQLYVCHDTFPDISKTKAISNSCMSLKEINDRLGLNLVKPNTGNGRTGCDCIISADIGQYNTCTNGCAYCYATNNARDAVNLNRKHLAGSSCLIGYVKSGDEIVFAKQESWK